MLTYDPHTIQSISGFMRPSYMAPCHITGRIAIAEDAITREQQRTIVRKERISLARSSKRQEVAVVKEYDS